MRVLVGSLKLILRGLGGSLFIRGELRFATGELECIGENSR